MRKWTCGIVLTLALAAACSKEGSNPTVAEAPGRSPGLKIAMIAKSSTNPVFLSARTGAEAAARELSQKHGVPIEIVWLTPPAEDGQVQAQRLAQAVNAGATAALISCSDAGKVTGAINDAVARGVPVMTFDSDAPESKRFAFLGIDDVKAGQRVLEELAEQIGDAGIIAIFSPRAAGAELVVDCGSRLHAAAAARPRQPSTRAPRPIVLLVIVMSLLPTVPPPAPAAGRPDAHWPDPTSLPR